MVGPLTIVVVDDDAADRTLASVVIQQGLAEATVLQVGDALGYAEMLAAGSFDVVVCARRLRWADGAELLVACKRRYANCASVLLGASSDLALDSPEAVASIDAQVQKHSAGFLRLPQAILGAVEKVQAREDSSESLDSLYALLESIAIGMLSVSGQGLIQEASPAAARILGFEAGNELLERSFPAMLADPGIQATCRKLLQEGASFRGVEATVARSNGSPARIRLAGIPQRGAGAEYPAFRIAIEDLAAHPDAGPDTRSREEVLKRSNEELEQLCYAVAHDLQEPAQLVARYARRLSERLGDGLDGTDQKALENLLGTTERMGARIDSVLRYLHLSVDERRRGNVDFNEAVAEALTNLKQQIDEAHVEIDCGLLPVLAANEIQIVQLFENLIDNAVKFSRGKPPRVWIEAEERTTDWVFRVRDNGIGMDPQSTSRIFGMFQRLHTADEFSGTGIGLALCKRIVDHHGGDIWVRSQPDIGSTFFFTFPKTEDEGSVGASA